MSNSSQNRRNTGNQPSPISGSSSSHQPEVAVENSDTSVPELNQVLSFEGFCKNYKCAISLRKLVPAIADDLRMRNMAAFLPRDTDE